jgi:hypothetical protein
LRKAAERNYSRNIHYAAAPGKLARLPLLLCGSCFSALQFLPDPRKNCSVEKDMRWVSVLFSIALNGRRGAQRKDRRSGAASGQSGKDFGQRPFLIALLHVYTS